MLEIKDLHASVNGKEILKGINQMCIRDSKKIARIPGERAKIAVESYDDRIDPVGACAVSYTHLDVYKRQVIRVKPVKMVLNGQSLMAIGLATVKKPQ